MSSVCDTNVNILTFSVTSSLWFVAFLKMVFSVVDVTFVVEREDIYLAQARPKTCYDEEEVLMKTTDYIE